jgi:hypothetical protein
VILRNPNRHRWTVIDNRILEDERLSWDARGLLAFLLSKPDKWNVNVTHLEGQSKAGRSKVRRILRELSEAGYLEYRKARGKGGLFGGTEIIIHETPPRVHFSDSPSNRHSDKRALVNTEYLVSTENKNQPRVPTPTNTVRRHYASNRKPSAAERALIAEQRLKSAD